MPGHPRLSCCEAVKTWMPGTSPGMTTKLLVFAPPLGKAMQRPKRFQQFLADGREAVAAGRLEFDETGLAQFRQPGLQHGRRGLVAGLAQGPRGQPLCAELPQDAQAPAPSQQVE